MNCSVVAHEEFMRRAGTIQPRVGGGVGGRGEVVVTHASYLTEGPVDNPLASANAAPSLRTGCNAFGGDRRWLG